MSNMQTQNRQISEKTMRTIAVVFLGIAVVFGVLSQYIF